jgi:hypothetical protein
VGTASFTRTRDARLANPGEGFAALRWAAPASQLEDDEAEFVDGAAQDFLAAERRVLDDAAFGKFQPLYIEARRHAASDLIRASKGDNSESDWMPKYPPGTPSRSISWTPSAATATDPTSTVAWTGRRRSVGARRRSVAWIGHRDLARVTPHDAVRWRNYRIGQNIAPKAVRDVWLAALRSIASYMVNESKLDANPFAGVTIPG